MDRGICHICIDDDYLGAELFQRDQLVACSECHGEVAGITLKELGQRLERHLRQFYTIGNEYRAFDGSDDYRGRIAHAGESLSDIIQERLGKCFSAHGEIVNAVMATDEGDPFEGRPGYWDDEQNYQYQLIIDRPDELPSWHQTKEEIQHGRRFFSPAAKSMFDNLFKEIDKINALSDRGPEPVCYELPANSQLFRARVVDSENAEAAILAAPAAQVGPPPSSMARSGRMNAEGISVLYASKDRGTCIAEMRPAIGSTLAVIQLTTQRSLRILDFRALERALGRTSVFDPDYAQKQIRLGALKQLHEWITAPVVPGREADYLITQTMAEYLAHVFERPFDGILFRSAQDSSGLNVVLFSRGIPFDGDLNDRFGVAYVEDSLSFVRIESLDVSFVEMSIARHAGNTYLLDPESKREFDGWR